MMAKPKTNSQHKELPVLAERCPLSFAIFGVARAHRALAGTLIADLGLYTGQELLLAQLGFEDGQSQKSLGQLIRSDHSTIAKTVGRLAAAGLVERRKDEEDARVTRVFLTDAGRSIQDRILEAWRQLEERTAIGLSAEEAETFLRLARKMRDRLE
jgi:DNA-binding MarR family transcriptional regulator